MNNLVYFNQQILPYNQAQLPLATHALHYGTGCFEGIRAYYDDKLRIFRLKEHLVRLRNSCLTLHFNLSESNEQITNTIIQLLRQNKYEQNVYIRPLVYKKDEIITAFNLDKLSDGFAILTVPMGHYLNTATGISAITSSWYRTSAQSIPIGAKPTGVYLNTSLAKTEAEDCGAGESILLNVDGTVAEGSAENIFLIQGNQLITPSLDQNILNGITRNTIIELAQKELGLTTIERPIANNQLYLASEVFLTGTGAEVTPIIAINNQPIGSGKVGEITQKLQNLYFNCVTGKLPQYSHWLTVV